ncbi:VOC family protein [Nocardia sp. NPDC051750]|uniref:VOC family protein n=1 Tax=Nocardia sp. NPDC051750 TaxID=3364325 RepID=UPI0037AFF3E8
MPIREIPWPAGTPCWVDCQVDDTDRARAFYSALLGWEIADTAPEADGYLMATVRGRPAAGIGPKPAGQIMQSTWTTYLATDDADATAAAVADAGGTVLAPPFDVMDIGRMFVAADPTGAVFGVWQARLHSGAGIYNEPGAYCWNEVHTDGYERAQSFYSQVFGWTFTEVGAGTEMTYATFALEPGGPPVGGIADATGIPDSGPSHWLAWFQVADTDATLTSAAELGGAVLTGPQDSPFGRMGVLSAPQGEAFGVIEISESADSTS